jgi:hypothetical protein
MQLSSFRTARLVLAASAVVSGLALTTTATSAAVPGGSVSGTVFRDLNANGIREGLEVGVGGINVVIFDDSGNAQVAVVTTADGTYVAPVPAAVGTAVRVEFGLPVGSFLKPGVRLANGATDVQFVPVGSADVDWAVGNPNDYCGSVKDTKLATNCWKWGDQLTDRKALGTWNFSTVDGSVPASSPPPNLGSDNHNLAFAAEGLASEIGTTYGLGFNRATGTLFAGAYYRRFAGLHDRATGAVYAVRGAGTATSKVSSDPWLDLNSLFGAGTAGEDAHPTAASGATLALSNPPKADELAWLHDTASWPLVNKVALGDIEVTEDNRYLYMVNLADRQLYRASAVTRPTTASDVDRTPLPTAPNCAADDSRPFGLGFHDGEGYVGVVCSAESAMTALGKPATDAYVSVDAAQKSGNPIQIKAAWAAFRAAIAPALAQLHGYIYRFDAATMPTGAASFTQILDINLGYERSSYDEMWMPWTNDFTSTILQNQNPYEQRWNEPVVSSFAFEGNTMYVGLRNRFGDRTSSRGGHPDPTYVQTYTDGSKSVTPEYNQTYGTRGAILRACVIGSAWKLESGGKCGNDIGNQFTPGPGGSLYYGRSSELSMGALVHATGAPEVVSTQMDPTTEFSNGTAMYLAGSLAAGSATDTRLVNGSFSVYYTPQTGAQSTFGKSNGLGDLELLCDGAPVEIGNRVWKDDNDNGRQDPSESGIPGVPVDLLSAGGSTIKSVVTDADGSFLFSSLTTPELKLSNPAHVGLTLRIKTNSPALPVGFGPKGKAAGVTDRADSDFVAFYPSLNEARSSVLPLDASLPVHHSIDFGFGPTPLPKTTLFAVTGDVWEDKNVNAKFDSGEPTGNLMVELLDATGHVVRSTSGSVSHYAFDRVPEGKYTVRFSDKAPAASWANCHVPIDASLDSDACFASGNTATTELLVLLDGAGVPAYEAADGPLDADYVARHVDAAYYIPPNQIGTT